MTDNKLTKQTDALFASLGGLDEDITLPIAALAPTASSSSLAKPDTSLVSSSGHSGVTSGVEERALKLLGSGVQAEAVANALGVTPSRIAQLLSEKHFAAKVAELRYDNLQSHNRRDASYDSLEDMLLLKLEKALPLMTKPESILKGISIVNGAKRRGQSAPAQVTNQQNIVNLILPAVITEKFAINIDNQVTKAGDQDLLTMASGNLLKQVEEAASNRLLEHTGEETNAQEERS